MPVYSLHVQRHRAVLSAIARLLVATSNVLRSWSWYERLPISY